MQKLQARQGQGAIGRRRESREFKGVLNGEVVNATIPFEKLDIYPEEIADYQISPQNVRRFVGTEFTNRPYYEDIKFTRNIEEPICVYWFPEDVTAKAEPKGHTRGTYYVANGWTRLKIAEHLNSGADGEKLNIKVPAIIYSLKPEQMWVIDRLRDLSDANELFSWFEDAIRINQIYAEHVQGKEPISMRKFADLVTEVTLRNGKINRDTLKSKLILGFYAEQIISAVAPHLSSLEVAQGELAAQSYRYLKAVTGNDITIISDDKLSNNLINEARNVWDDGIEALSQLTAEVRAEVGADAPDNTFMLALRKRLAAESRKANSTPTNSEEAEPDESPTAVKVTKNSATAQLRFKIKKNEFTGENYSQAMEAMRQLDAQIKASLEYINSLKKGD